MFLPFSPSTLRRVAILLIRPVFSSVLFCYIGCVLLLSSPRWLSLLLHHAPECPPRAGTWDGQPLSWTLSPLIHSSFLFLAVLLCSLYLWTGPEVPEYRLHHGVFPGMCPKDHCVWLLGMSWNLSQHHSCLPFSSGTFPAFVGREDGHRYSRNGSHTCPPNRGLVSTAQKTAIETGWCVRVLGEKTKRTRSPAPYPSSYQLCSCQSLSVVKGWQSLSLTRT